MNDLQLMVIGAWKSLPNWLLALLVLVLGWCVALVMRLVIAKVFEWIKFNQMCEKTKFSDFLRKGQVFYSPSQLIGAIVYWIVFLTILLWSANLLNIKMAANLSERLISVVPGFVSAVLILVVGIIIVSFVGNFVMTIASNAAFPHARLLSQATKVLGIILVLSLTVEQADIGTKLIASLFQMVIGAVVFGTALAFGLGCKDMARDATERFLHKLREKSRVERDSDMEG